MESAEAMECPILSKMDVDRQQMCSAVAPQGVLALTGVPNRHFSPATRSQLR